MNSIFTGKSASLGSFAAGVVVTLVVVMLGLRQPVNGPSHPSPAGSELKPARVEAESPAAHADDCEERLLRREAELYQEMAQDQARWNSVVRYAWISDLDAGRHNPAWENIIRKPELGGFTEWSVVRPYGTEILPKMVANDNNIEVLRSTMKEFRETMEKYRVLQEKVQYKLLVTVFDPNRTYVKSGGDIDMMFSDDAKK